MVSDNDEIDDVIVLEYKDGKLYGTQVYTDIIEGQTTTFTYIFERNA